MISIVVGEISASRKTIEDSGLIDTKNFSKGQIRRLALVFLLLEGRDIIAFDEFSADQDPLFCKYFYNELLYYLKLWEKRYLLFPTMTDILTVVTI